MTDSLIPSGSISEPLPVIRRKGFRLWPILLGLGIVINSAIWVLATLYLKSSEPVYTSNWATVIPAASTNKNVTFADSGQVVDGSTPYKYLVSVDPRKHYMFMAASPTVLASAAASLKMSTDEFGAPVVKLGNGTTIMEFSMTGSSPAEAQRKAEAMHKALVQQIDALREQIGQQESERQQRENQALLQDAQQKLETANQKLASYVRTSPLRRTEQVGELSGTLESLRQQRELALAELNQVNARLDQLSSNLNTSVDQASGIIELQADELFQKFWEDYTAAKATVTELSTQWTSNSPQLVSAQDKLNAARSALISRGRELTGQTIIPETLEQPNFSISSQGGNREALFQQIVTLRSDKQGLVAKVQTFDRQISELEFQVKNLIQEEFTLNDLQRNAEVAESFFKSTVAQINLSKPDLATSYPVMQLLISPSLPEEGGGVDATMVYTGAFALSFLVTTGLLLIWWEKGMYRKPEEEEVLAMEPVDS
jgi:uncharacterized protein involved in exopolysaccharide biosynthesis